MGKILYRSTKKGEEDRLECVEDHISGYSIFKHYDYYSYYMNAEQTKEWDENGTIPEQAYAYLKMDKGDKLMAKAKNKNVSETHYVVRDTHVGFVGDNFTDLADAKDFAAKQFKTKRSSLSATTARDIVVYKSVAVIKEPVPVVDWVELA